MYRKCTTEISVRHQRQVTAALLELMGKMPYEAITVTQLCQSAGISRRIFYHLFTNKTGALYALVDYAILDSAHHGSEISDDLERFFWYWKEQKPLMDALKESGYPGLLLERMIISVLAEDYDLRYWLEKQGWGKNSKQVIVFGLSGLMGLVYSWYAGGYRQEPRELAAIVEQLYIRK